jgi:hypothetical protein
MVWKEIISGKYLKHNNNEFQLNFFYSAKPKMKVYGSQDHEEFRFAYLGM